MYMYQYKSRDIHLFLSTAVDCQPYNVLMARSKPAARKTRKKPISTGPTATATPSISRAAAQARISEFHHALKRGPAVNHPETLDAYQKLSQAGQDKQRGGDSSKVLVPWIKPASFDAPLRWVKAYRKLM